MVLDSVDLGPGALVAMTEQPVVHLVALLGYLVKTLLLLIQLSDLLLSYLPQELHDEDMLDYIVVKVRIRQEQALKPVGKRGDCFSLAYSDVRPLGDGVLSNLLTLKARRKSLIIDA